MKIKIFNPISYQLYPLIDGMVDINASIEDLKEIGLTKCFDMNTYQIIPYSNPTLEIATLKNWYETYYTQHEQKYRRLHSLGKLTDEGKDPYNELINLYNEAEIKRARIQELERLLSDSSK